jgi:hypothetical protein
MAGLSPLQINVAAGLIANDGGLRVAPSVVSGISNLTTATTRIVSSWTNAVAGLGTALEKSWVDNNTARSVLEIANAFPALYNYGPNDYFVGDGNKTAFYLPIPELGMGNLTVTVNNQVFRPDPRGPSYLFTTVTQPLNIPSNLGNSWVVDNNKLIFKTAPAFNNTIQVGYFPTSRYVQLFVYGLLGAKIAGQYDYTKFVQIFTSAYGYTDQLNTFIKGSKKGATYLGPTFTNMNELTTGGWSSVTTNMRTFGLDLKASGNVINFKTIDSYGLPSNLVATIKSLGNGFIGFEEQLRVFGVDQQVLNNIGNAGYTPDLAQEKLIFRAMQLVKSDQLLQILSVLGCTTKNIATLDQLLDLTKLLPNSYSTLLAPTANGLRNIFNTGGTSVNDIFSKLGPSLQACTNGALGSSNAAFKDSILQITGIATKDTGQVADVISTLEVNPSLTLVNNLTQPVPQSVVNFYANLAPGGSGPDGTYVLADLMGSCAGLGNVPLFINNYANAYNGINNKSAYGTLCDLGNTLGATLQGLYGVPGVLGANVVIPSGPAAGNYGNSNAAIQLAVVNGILPQITTYRDQLIVAAGSSYTNAVTAYNNMVNRIEQEITLLGNATINVGNVLKGPDTSIMSWSGQLTQFALDDTTGGANTLITLLANTSTFTGQCMLASMAESRNQERLASEGRTSITVTDSNTITVPTQTSF